MAAGSCECDSKTEWGSGLPSRGLSGTQLASFLGLCAVCMVVPHQTHPHILVGVRQAVPVYRDAAAALKLLLAQRRTQLCSVQRLRRRLELLPEVKIQVLHGGTLPSTIDLSDLSLFGVSGSAVSQLIAGNPTAWLGAKPFGNQGASAASTSVAPGGGRRSCGRICGSAQPYAMRLLSQTHTTCMQHYHARVSCKLLPFASMHMSILRPARRRCYATS